MTAEIAIANLSAIAMAADSAVTIGGQKIYNSALKLFSLSKVAPVGTMMYGNAALIDVPWETLIKSHRKWLGSSLHEKLDGYSDSFLTFLRTNLEFFPEASQQRWLEYNVGSCFVEIRNKLLEELRSASRQHSPITLKEVTDMLSRIVKTYQYELRQKEFAHGFGEADDKEIKSRYTDIVKQIISDIFEEVKAPTSTVAALCDIASFIHTRDVPTPGSSGLVIAGYGESEPFPVVNTYDIDGMILDKLKYRVNHEKSHVISATDPCAIIPFAQGDMVATFMDGINPELTRFVHGYLGQVFARLPELIGDQDSRSTDLFKANTQKLLEDFLMKFHDFQAQYQSMPVVRMVKVLPKDELAAMAEALVNLTAFKRRITESIETVGGPIDVAVISKGDGLVWVKRKHYFPPELNQHFFANYFRGI